MDFYTLFLLILLILLLPGIRRNDHFINYSQGVMEKIWVHWISIIPSFLLSGILLFHLEFFPDVQTRFQEVGWGVERQKRRRERGRAAYLHKVWISQQIPHKGLWYSGPDSETENDLKLKWNTVMTQMLPENLPLLVLKSTITGERGHFLDNCLLSSMPLFQQLQEDKETHVTFLASSHSGEAFPSSVFPNSL